MIFNVQFGKFADIHSEISPEVECGLVDIVNKRRQFTRPHFIQTYLRFLGSRTREQRPGASNCNAFHRVAILLL